MRGSETIQRKRRRSKKADAILRELRKRNRRPWLTMINVVLLCIALMEGCVLRQPIQQTALPVVCYSADVAEASYYWAHELQRRYKSDDILLVIVHGTNVEGVWTAFPDGQPKGVPVSTLVQRLRLIHPMKRFVLICCNPGHSRLEESGVTYSLDDVWVRPDNAVGFFSNMIRDAKENDCGSIWEFVENP